MVPNLNWAGDTARPRFFQVRGVGELEQYQGAPNPSVGFLLDDIDFSGLGSIATLFDIDRVEVLRGPQGTLYGANALAGLIYMRSAEPTDVFSARAELDAGDYGSRAYGGVVSGPVSALDSAFRLSVQRSTSDGFYRNAYLGRHDTDRRDDLTLRGRWRYHPSEAVRLDLTLLRIQMNDGYDAFAIDNSRTTQSDHPGTDLQYSTGLSARLTCACVGSATLTSIATYADTSVRYGFDGDWGNPSSWAPYVYDYTEVQTRRRGTHSLEFRLAGDAQAPLSWLAGVYASELQERLRDDSAGVYDDPSKAYFSSTHSVLSSRYRSRNVALYGQLDARFGARLTGSLGIRGEKRLARYGDSTAALAAPITGQVFKPSDDLWGGHASLDYALPSGSHLYGLIARGYKAGGFNLSQGLSAAERTFAPESVVNVEVGHKGRWAGGRISSDTSVFYMRRQSPQLKTGIQLDPHDPNTFIYYTGNARSGFNYGLESSLAWQATSTLAFGSSFGWLESRYNGFIQNGVILPPRELPHAPHWQGAADVSWKGTSGLLARLDVTGMGGFYYDLPPNWTHSRPYALVNGRLGWQSDRYEIFVWGRNLFDKNYTVRGFYFGNEPPDFSNKLYTQLGEPRNFGIHLTARY